MNWFFPKPFYPHPLAGSHQGKVSLAIIGESRINGTEARRAENALVRLRNGLVIRAGAVLLSQSIVDSFLENRDPLQHQGAQ